MSQTHAAQVGNFAIAVKSPDGDVKHARIDHGPTPAKRFEIDGRGFATLDALVKQLVSAGDLKSAFRATYYREPWFQGDLSELEASEVLSGSAPGTFLVRFNLEKSGEHFVVSYVDQSGHVSHVNVNREPSGLAVLSFDFVQRSYEDLHEVISANAKLLSRPCTLDRNLFDMSAFESFGADASAAGRPGAGNDDDDDDEPPTEYGALASVAANGGGNVVKGIGAAIGRQLPTLPGVPSRATPQPSVPKLSTPQPAQVDYGAIPGDQVCFARSFAAQICAKCARARDGAEHVHVAKCQHIAYHVADALAKERSEEAGQCGECGRRHCTRAANSVVDSVAQIADAAGARRVAQKVAATGGVAAGKWYCDAARQDYVAHQCYVADTAAAPRRRVCAGQSDVARVADAATAPRRRVKGGASAAPVRARRRTGGARERRGQGAGERRRHNPAAAGRAQVWRLARGAQQRGRTRAALCEDGARHRARRRRTGECTVSFSSDRRLEVNESRVARKWRASERVKPQRNYSATNHL